MKAIFVVDNSDGLFDYPVFESARHILGPETNAETTKVRLAVEEYRAELYGDFHHLKLYGHFEVIVPNSRVFMVIKVAERRKDKLGFETPEEVFNRELWESVTAALMGVIPQD